MSESTQLPLPTAHPAPRSQFSLLALFILLSAIPLLLGAIYGLATLLGMSRQEISQVLMQFAYSLPNILVWLIGLALSIRRIREHRAFVWSTAAFGGLLVGTTLFSLIQSWIIQQVPGSGDPYQVGIWLTASSVVFTLFNTVCWILLLIGHFMGVRQNR